MSQFDAGQGALLQAVTQGPRLLPPTAQLSCDFQVIGIIQPVARKKRVMDYAFCS